MNRVSYVKTDEIFIEKYTLKKPQADMHYHHAYELYYILEGEREYFVGDKFFMLYKGDFIFIPKGMLHRTDGKGATRILVFFKDSFVEPFLKDAVLKQILPTEPFVFKAAEGDNTVFENMLTALLKTYEKSSKNADSDNNALICGQLFSLLTFVRFSNNIHEPQVYSNKHIEMIIQYINANHTQITSIDEIAEYAGISKYYLCHLFKTHLGVSLITYLNTLKIRTACELIKEGKYSMLEIALMCGFNSSPYFCTTFKDEKGMTPSEYAKKIKKE